MANNLESSHRWESHEMARRAVGIMRICLGSAMACVGMMVSGLGLLSPWLGLAIVLVCTVYTVRGLLEIKGLVDA